MDDIIEEVKAKRKQVEMMYLLFQHNDIDTINYDKLSDKLLEIDDLFFDIVRILANIKDGM